MDGYMDRIEVLQGRSGRRMRSEAERARIAAESLVPGAKVADFARPHDVTSWQFFDWRRKLRSGGLAVSAEAMQEPMLPHWSWSDRNRPRRRPIGLAAAKHGRTGSNW